MNKESLKGRNRFAEGDVDTEETSCEDVDWTQLAQDRDEQHRMLTR